MFIEISPSNNNSEENQWKMARAKVEKKVKNFSLGNVGNGINFK
jgi:hypothetical protein